MSPFPTEYGPFMPNVPQSVPNLRSDDGLVEHRFDIVIMGAGQAGLQAARNAKRANPNARVAILTAAPASGFGDCSHKTHGANAAINPEDSIADHIWDTMRGSGMIADPILVDLLCHGAPDAIRDLERLGVPFDKEGDRFVPGFYGGSTHARSIHSADMLGLLSVTRLWEEVRRLGVEAFHSRQVVTLVTDDATFGGCIAIDLETGQPEYFAAPVGVSAMGGGACVYPIRTIVAEKQATLAIALLENGVSIIDAEMVQFHPTGLNRPGLPGHGTILEEELRAQGARFHDRNGVYFMPRYHELAERATRDVNSRACYTEIRAGNGTDSGGVWLDLSKLPKDFLRERFPYMLERCRTYVDLAGVDRVETSPAAHFWMGGVPIGVDTQTPIRGLFACGEDAGGIHGGNRLGGNGVSDALVFGAIAGRAAAAHDTISTGRFDPNAARVRLLMLPYGAEADNLERSIQSVMWTHVGPIRDDQGLLQADRALAQLQNRYAANVVALPARYLDAAHASMRGLYQKLQLARAITAAARERTNSVGAHFRTDAISDNRIYNTDVRIDEKGVFHTGRRYRDGTMDLALAPEDAA